MGRVAILLEPAVGLHLGVDTFKESRKVFLQEGGVDLPVHVLLEKVRSDQLVSEDTPPHFDGPPPLEVVLLGAVGVLHGPMMFIVAVSVAITGEQGLVCPEDSVDKVVPRKARLVLGLCHLDKTIITLETRRR